MADKVIKVTMHEVWENSGNLLLVTGDAAEAERARQAGGEIRRAIWTRGEEVS